MDGIKKFFLGLKETFGFKGHNYTEAGMRKTGNKGQAAVTGALIAIATVAMFLYVIPLVLDKLDDSFASEFTGGNYESVYNDTRDNSVTATSLATIVIILLGGGMLIMAVSQWMRG